MDKVPTLFDPLVEWFERTRLQRRPLETEQRKRKMYEYDNEEIEWNCDICEDPLGRNSYVTRVNTVTGEVVKAEDGRVTDMEPQFPPEIEHLCYTCWAKKYKEPVEALRTCVNVVANVIELLEAEANDDFYNPKEALDKLNKLVVYVADVLPSLSQKEEVTVG